MAFIVKNTTIITPLDLIAPLSCRGCGAIGCALCERCKNNIISNRNQKTLTINEPNFPPTFIIDHRDNLIGILIHDYKYSSCRKIATSLAELLDAIIPQIDGQVVIVPLPTIPKHVRMRGFDHTLKIAQKFAHFRSDNYKTKKILLRKRNTVQVGSNKEARIEQAENAYTINNKIKINQNATYILLDDVWTTGASMKSAVKKLRETGAKKIIVALLAMS